MKNEALYFQGPGRIAVVEEEISSLLPHEVRVRTELSAISAGTELLFYRDQVPKDLPVDESIHGMQELPRYPLKYGYACVGSIVEAGEEVAREMIGRKVFSLHPHESTFTASAERVTLLPPEMAPEDTVFLPMVETALTLILDGGPAAGEKVVVFGQGVVGLLTAGLLARYPLECLVTIDRIGLRRERSRALGADVCLDPDVPGIETTLNDLLSGRYRGADLCYELTGDPRVLGSAIAVAGFNARIVVGSWYGEKQAPLPLGGRFHRSRQRLISSQVSTIDPQWSGRWTRARRTDVALKMLEQLKPSTLITHRFPVADAAQAYALLDQHPEEALQVILTYP